MPYRYLLIIGLTIFWLLLSGYWTNPLILALGAASVALATWMAMRIEKKYAFKDKGVAMLLRQHTFWPWIFTEIIKSNISVLKCIWMPKTYPISPIIRQLKMQPQSRIARTLYANSITLTPGTVSVEVRDQEVLVYALLEEAMEDLEGGEMGKRVHKLEGDN
ncbi:Na+/H+ antiporter subunit E [Cocleimonas flava]|uniref:Multisubunit sodium/proton antiporter MrpE subunit n=1 Tax=Cocleimonas flava TaxID=634765 RepID=A0A4R1ETG4_9GAMM|nr:MULTISPECIES: Na+/H+ antiporter subunit E [Cocleimonas]MEB8434252.1 Na+/H+ antiporter subunit E [Cocleimonas sp. KMM 6892]MEC4717129.1 Na+/H+ antiporter subunit E [Cocleimonas sp. KMM 6895]MEC4746524.1 Na+/H+ antiporter subunit E [Cocleimonas sp. KMM 6896]TCJ84503.1 multisubunit sodium/proton antiporter MrpE subunit [Cocleimonas flava]